MADNCVTSGTRRWARLRSASDASGAKKIARANRSMIPRGCKPPRAMRAICVLFVFYRAPGRAHARRDAGGNRSHRSRPTPAGVELGSPRSATGARSDPRRVVGGEGSGAAGRRSAPAPRWSWSSPWRRRVMSARRVVASGSSAGGRRRARRCGGSSAETPGQEERARPRARARATAAGRRQQESARRGEDDRRGARRIHPMARVPMQGRLTITRCQ